MFNNAGFRFAGESVTGLVRRHNEDSFLISVPAGRKTALAVVADGVGGHRHGEIVSYISCRDLGRAFLNCPDEELLKEGGAEKFLSESVSDINRRVFDINYEEFAPHPMSSTLIAVLFTPGNATMLNIGDSRFYMSCGKELFEQLSTDHTLANDKEFEYLNKKKFPYAVNTISRSIGSKYNLKPEIKRVALKGSERFLLCSDGVYRDLSDSKVSSILCEADAPETAVNRIMRSVLINGAHDNTTVITVFPL